MSQISTAIKQSKVQPFPKFFFTEVSIMQWPRKTASEAVLASDWRWNTLKLTREMMAWFYRPIEKAIFFQNSFSFPPFRNVTNFTPINRETCVKLFERYRQTTYNSKKCKKYEIRFTEKTALFRKGFQTLNARPERTALSSNVDQFCKPKSSCFVRGTAVKRISFFLEFLMLYVWGLLSIRVLR